MKKTALMTAAVILGAILLLPGRDGAEVKRVTTDGSTSVEKVIGSLGEAYENSNEKVSISFNPTGSSAGIRAVLENRCDIGVSSRRLKDNELASGLEETLLAYDGIAVVVSNENPVSELTREQLADIYTGRITRWSEARGRDAQIVVIGREAGSGTRDGFESALGASGRCIYRQELTSTGDVLTTVSRNPDAIGYISLASLRENVKALRVNGVEISEESIRDGSYALKRPFLLITKKDKRLSETAEAFMNYIKSPQAAEIVSGAGAVYAGRE